jgi:hypothetical protein
MLFRFPGQNERKRGLGQFLSFRHDGNKQDKKKPEGKKIQKEGGETKPQSFFAEESQQGIVEAKTAEGK